MVEQHAIGQKSLVEMNNPQFQGTRVTTVSWKNSWTALNKSSVMIFHVFLKKYPLKPSIPGALLSSIANRHFHFISSDWQTHFPLLLLSDLAFCLMMVISTLGRVSATAPIKPR